jgi:hypothetical protein
MSDDTGISRARTELFDALVLGAGAPSWRVHRTSPAQIAAPSMWIDSVELAVDTVTGAAFVAATFPVFVVVDGTVRRQIEELDDVLARVWTAAATVGEPTTARAQALDVGGPSLRAHVVNVDVLIQARTLCPLDLVTTGGVAHA